MAEINDHTELALLKQRVEGLEKVMNAIEARDSKRIRAGVLALGSLILTLFGAIVTLGNYIWKLKVG